MSTAQNLRQSGSLRCRLGIHQWTTIPAAVQRKAASVGLNQPPVSLHDHGGWAGTKGPRRCWRCGVQA